MLITMKTLYASPEGALQPGQTADVAPALGKALVSGGYAVAGKEEFSPADADAENQKAGARRGRRPSTKRDRAGGDENPDDPPTDPPNPDDPPADPPADPADPADPPAEPKD